MPTRKDLARWLVHAALNRVPLSGFADHRVSKSVYLDDPEGNGIELCRPRSLALAMDRRHGDNGHRSTRIDSLVSLTNTKVSDYPAAPEGLRIGHVHLRVGDLAKAGRFLGDTIGFDPTRRRNGAAFLASGRYHHHLGLNVWQSAGAPAAMMRPSALPGFRWKSRKRNCSPVWKSDCARQVSKSQCRRMASRPPTLGHPGAADQGLSTPRLTPRSRSSSRRRDKTPR